MQVYVEKKLMGDLNVHVSGRSWTLHTMPELAPISFESDPEVMTKSVAVNTISLQVDWAKYRLTEMNMTLMGPDQLAHVLELQNVPPDAERIVDFHSDSVTFRWKILTCREEDFEEVFDLEAFTPA